MPVNRTGTLVVALIIKAFTYHGPTRDDGSFPFGEKTSEPICGEFVESAVFAGVYPVQPDAIMNPAINMGITKPEYLIPFIQCLSELFLPHEVLLLYAAILSLEDFCVPWSTKCLFPDFYEYLF
jgi:hypothetical protein